MTPIPDSPIRAVALAAALLPLLIPRAFAQTPIPPIDPLPGSATPEAPDEVPALELSVAEAVRIALTNNLDLKLNEIASEVAEYDYIGSWGAFDWIFDASGSFSTGEFETGPDPQNPDLPAGLLIDSDDQAFAVDLNKPLTTGGSLAFHWDYSEGDSTTQAVDDPSLSSSTELLPTDTVSVTYVQPLRRGAWSRYATATQRESELAFQQQLEAERQGRQALILDVHNAYWALVSALEQRDVSSSSLDLGLSQLSQNERRLEAGVGTEVEVLQARAELATRTETLLLSENQVDQSEDDLKMLLFNGRDAELWETNVSPTTPLPSEVGTAGVPNWSQALMTALDQRSDLRQQRLEIDAVRIRHTRTQSERLAGVDLRLSASSRNVDTDFGGALGDAFAYEFPAYSATLSYNMPIGNRTANYAERAARANVRAALLTYDQLETQTVADVRRAVRNVYYQTEAVRAAEESLVLARRQLEAEEARQNEGLSTTFQVLEFQQTLIEAMSSERNARVEYAKALVELRNAQGLLDEGRQ